MEDTQLHVPAEDEILSSTIIFVNIQTSQTLTVSCTVVRFKVFVQISILLIPGSHSEVQGKSQVIAQYHNPQVSL